MTSKTAAGLLGFGILAFVTASCGSSPAAPESVGASKNPIQGGMADSTHSFAVGVCGGAIGGPMQGNNCQALCSGALIAPNLVLTARHCVDNVSSDTVDCSTDTFGSLLFPEDTYYVTSDAFVGDPAAAWYQVSQIITPTPTSFCGNDLSLLVLRSNVPSSEVPTFAIPEIWYPIDASMFTTSETAIGYGLDAPNDMSSAGQRRILENIPIACIPGDSNATLACAPVDVSGVAANEFEAGNGPCEGDSGSSAYEQSNFDKGTFLSLGVLSRGGVSGNTCVGSVYTQLYPWQSLIVDTAKQAAAAGGYSAPSWTSPPAHPDAGAHDGAKSSDGSSGTGDLPLGASCQSDGNCASGQCISRSASGGYTCSQACSSSAPCPLGFSCFMDYCFSDGSSAKTTNGGGSSGGCALSPSEPDAGAGRLAFFALGCAAAVGLARRNNRRGARAPLR